MPVPTTLRPGALAVPLSLAVLMAGGHLGVDPALAAPVTVAHFDFDDEGGEPDAQGWQVFEEHGTEEVYFHVEDFTGAGHEAAPLEGSRSMWCGATAEDPRTCWWVAPPGYGHNWRQNLTSMDFAVQGDVTLEFLVDMEIENSYDFVFVQYQDPAGQWVTLDSYSCGFSDHCGPQQKSYTVESSAHDGTIRFRFFFTSDGAGDNEGSYFAIFEKAFLVDGLTVSDDTGVIDYQDFESEPVGDTATADGHWYGEPNTDTYIGGALVDGLDTLQETTPVNETHIWAFTEGSTRDYGCAGHPEQLVVPEARNEIRSPRIDLTHDADGLAIAGLIDSVEVSFDVYRDLSSADQKWYTWRVRTYSEECMVLGGDDGWAREGEKDWYRHRIAFVPEAEVVSIEVSLGVLNTNFDSNECRSHAPLFDNVTVTRFGGVGTAVDEPASSSRLVLRPNRPNPFNPRTTILYEIPDEAGHVSLRLYDLAGRLVRTLIDGPAPSGASEVVWNGRNDHGQPVASGSYFCRLSAAGEETVRRMLLLK